MVSTTQPHTTRVNSRLKFFDDCFLYDTNKDNAGSSSKMHDSGEGTKRLTF